MTLTIALIIFLILLLLRIPIALVLGIISVVILFITDSLGLIINAPQKLFSSLESYSLLAIPLFMLAGEIMNEGGITKRLIVFSQTFVGHFRGGLAYVNVIANTVLSAIMGSAVAQIAMMSKIMVPAMEKEGYKREFGAATTAAAGLLGPIIPPSMLFIIYGASAGVSIGDMFLAGIIPGILLALAFCIYIAYVGYKEKFPSTEKATWRERGISFLKILPALLIPGILIWGIVTGVFTPTESAGIACIIAFIVSFFYKDLKLKQLPVILVNTATSTAIVTLLISMASVFGWALTFERIPQMIAEWMSTVTSDPFVFYLLINIFLLICGMFMDGIALIIILTPIFIPILPVFNIDPIHFGVILCINVTIGILTPPVGSGLFLASSMGNVKVETLFKALWPFIVISVIVLLILTYIPNLVMFIPDIVD